MAEWNEVAGAFCRHDAGEASDFEDIAFARRTTGLRTKEQSMTDTPTDAAVTSESPKRLNARELLTSTEIDSRLFGMVVALLTICLLPA